MTGTERAAESGAPHGSTVADDLDMSPDGMEREAREAAASAPADPWLARRALTFGASEVAALLIALGRRQPDGAPKYLVENARRLLHVKAGLRRAAKVGRAAREGSRSERAILSAWAADTACMIRDQLTAITHADAAPKSWYPLIDRHCPRLSCTPDGWARSVLGEDVILEVKATTAPVLEPHWWWTVQVQAALAVTACAWGAVVIGDEWAAHWREPGLVHAHVVERDEVVIAEIRESVEDGWRRIAALKEASR